MNKKETETIKKQIEALGWTSVYVSSAGVVRGTKDGVRYSGVDVKNFNLPAPVEEVEIKEEENEDN